MEPPRPQWVRESRWAPWLAVGTVCVGALMGQLDASIVTVALPAIGRDLHADLGAVEWVVLAYIVVLVGTVAFVGRIADSAGRKLLYSYGFAVFTAASAGCALAPSFSLLVLCRVVQGAGAVLLQANSVALIRNVAPPGRLGAAVGLQGAAQAVGLAAGPSVGGVLVAAGGWRLIFLVNVPLGVIALGLAWFLIPRTRQRVPFAGVDAAGAVILAACAALVLVSLSLAVVRVAPVAAALAGAGALGVGAAGWVRQRTHPGSVIDAALGRQPAFRLGNASALLAYTALFGVLLVVPYFLETGRAVSARDAGLLLSALPLALAVFAPLGGRLADAMGPGVPTRAGMAGAAAGLVVAAADPSGAVLVAGLALAGAGFGAYIPANNAAVVGAAPRARAGAAGGLLNLTRGLGTALGVALGALLYGLVAGAGTGVTATASGGLAGVRVSMATLAACTVAAGVLAARRDETRAGPSA